MHNIMIVSAFPVLGLHMLNGVAAVVEVSIAGVEKVNGLCVPGKATKALVMVTCGKIHV
jgi:hypothetical protein